MRTYIYDADLFGFIDDFIDNSMILYKTKSVVAPEVIVKLAIWAFEMLNITGPITASLRCRYNNVERFVYVFCNIDVRRVQIVKILAYLRIKPQ
jgi:hypothetical protein